MIRASKTVKTGYMIEALGKKVYSLDEINYFLYSRIDLVYKDFFCPEFFDYLDNELGEKKMADALRQIHERNGAVHEFVRCVFEGSGFYSDSEINHISQLVMNIDSMGPLERLKIQGDKHYKNGNFTSAVRCYLEILNHMDDENLSDAFYGHIAYSVGVIYAKRFMTKSANTYFAYAYELYPDINYAKACLYMSMISGDDKEMLSAIMHYNLSDDVIDSVRMRLDAIKAEVEGSDEVRAFTKYFAQNTEKVIDEWKNEYYNYQS